jgi:hypothetical protein
MKTKSILHLVTFVLTFAVSVTVAGAFKSLQGASTAEKITQVLTEDIANGTTRRKKCRNTNIYLAVRTNDYVSASEKLDTTGLPNDFRAAWQNHMRAWRNHSDYLNENKYSSGFDADYDEVSARQISEINRTWWEVLRIAKTNGATIPAGAYY